MVFPASAMRMQPLTGTQGPRQSSGAGPDSGPTDGTFDLCRNRSQKERIIAMQCVPRAEAPEDLVSASEASSLVTGQSINLDGGVTGS
jgi:hypothetical protein